MMALRDFKAKALIPATESCDVAASKEAKNCKFVTLRYVTVLETRHLVEKDNIAAVMRLYAAHSFDWLRFQPRQE